MSCDHCSSRPSREILGIPGVVSANVNHLTGIAVIDCGNDIPDSVIRETVEDAAFIISAEREK